MNRTATLRRGSSSARAAALVLLAAAAGCQTSPPAPDRATVSDHLAHRVGHTVPCRPAGGVVLPPGASLDDGLTEDEAVAIALWNNAAFQELLADLGLARGDLVQAGLLPNPEFVYFWPAPDKPFKYLLDFPIEAVWLRPIRVRSAAREADRTAERLTQAGLDLMRDVRQAYADAVLARERVRVAAESVKLRGRVAELAGKRLAAGDISPQEEATAKIDALQAEQDATRIGYDVPVADERLRNLLGLGPLRGPLPLDPLPPPPCRAFDPDALTAEALATRPDALAAAQAAAATEARLRFARIGWVRMLGLLDATSGRVTGHEFSPALRFTVPLFNRNQGGIAKAEAELEKATRARQTVANQVILDVQRANLQYRQACAEMDVLRTKVRPEVEGAVRRAQAAYQEGNVAIFVVLATTQQLLDNYLREAQLHGDLRRTWAELERSVGRRLTQPEAAHPPEAPTAPPASPPVGPADSKFAPPAPPETVAPASALSPAPPRPEHAAAEPVWTTGRPRP